MNWPGSGWHFESSLLPELGPSRSRSSEEVPLRQWQQQPAAGIYNTQGFKLEDVQQPPCRRNELVDMIQLLADANGDLGNQSTGLVHKPATCQRC